MLIITQHMVKGKIPTSEKSTEAKEYWQQQDLLFYLVYLFFRRWRRRDLIETKERGEEEDEER